MSEVLWNVYPVLVMRLVLVPTTHLVATCCPNLYAQFAAGSVAFHFRLFSVEISSVIDPVTAWQFYCFSLKILAFSSRSGSHVQDMRYHKLLVSIWQRSIVMMKLT